MGKLEDQVAIVTGAAQGLGRAFADRLAAEGAHIVACDLRDAVHDIEGLTYVADVRQPDTARMVVDGALARHGRIDVLVNNAGIVRPTAAGDDWAQGLDDYDAIMATNTKGAFLFGRAVAPTMIDQGAGNIVNIGTDHVFTRPGVDVHGHGSMDVYNASKWALLGLTLDWAVSMKPNGVRVNCVHMGATDTEMLRSWMGDRAEADASNWMQPTAIADVVVDLIAEGVEGRTGQNIGMWVDRPISIDDSTHVGARLPS